MNTTDTKENVLFDDFSINDLYKRIYLNQKMREDLIKNLLDELKLLIVETTDAAIIGPIVKDLTDISVKNDEQLIKLATAAIRLLTTSKTNKDMDNVFELTDIEKNEILAKLNNIEADVAI